MAKKSTSGTDSKGCRRRRRTMLLIIVVTVGFYCVCSLMFYEASQPKSLPTSTSPTTTISPNTHTEMPSPIVTLPLSSTSIYTSTKTYTETSSVTSTTTHSWGVLTSTPRVTNIPTYEIRYINATTPVNIRLCASTSCEITTTMLPGNEIRIVDIDNGWYQIVLDDGNPGYVAAFLTSMDRPNSAPQQTAPIQSGNSLVQPTTQYTVPAPPSGWPAYCNQSCAQLTCEQVFQCGGHPERDSDGDGRACESQCR